MDPIFIEEENLDEIAEYDEETLEQIEEERCLDIIDEFKNEIKKEPEFISIDNISSTEIYNLTCMDHKFTKDILTYSYINFVCCGIGILNSKYFGIPCKYIIR